MVGTKANQNPQAIQAASQATARAKACKALVFRCPENCKRSHHSGVDDLEADEVRAFDHCRSSGQFDQVSHERKVPHGKTLKLRTTNAKRRQAKQSIDTKMQIAIRPTCIIEHGFEVAELIRQIA